MYNQVRFRRLDLDDLTRIMEIERAAYQFPWSASMVRDSLQAAHCQTWGMSVPHHSDLIGFGMLSIVLDEVELLGISVLPGLQGKGYGAQLLQFLIEQARRAKADKIFLEVRQTNDPAVALYQKAGFESVDIRQDYYPTNNRHERDDATVMLLSL